MQQATVKRLLLQPSPMVLVKDTMRKQAARRTVKNKFLAVAVAVGSGIAAGLLLR